MEPASMSYRNIQGLRAIAALMVFASHMFWDITPMRTHWARPYIEAIGPSGVDIFFVISGFIIYNVAKRSAAQMGVVGRGRAVYEFAMKRIIRIYPLYWIAFGVAALIMIWVPLPVSFVKKPQLELILLINGIPNFRVQVAWTLTFEVYFYAVTALNLFLFPKKIFTGLLIWFAVVGCAAMLGTAFGLPIPLDYVFAPIVLEFLYCTSDRARPEPLLGSFHRHGCHLATARGDPAASGRRPSGRIVSVAAGVLGDSSRTHRVWDARA
jgi:exopolysaccharide production protein ExoZ